MLAGPWISWAQATGPDPDALAIQALRRWCEGLTLSSPEPVPGPTGLWALLLGLAAALLLAILVQGPSRALGQFFDLPGHFRLLSAASLRLRRSGRLVATLLGTTVMSWTASQYFTHANADRLADLVLLKKTRSLGELAVEQGTLAALTPWRDVFGLGSVLVLVAVATALIFKLAADRWGAPSARAAAAGPWWTTPCWGALAFFVTYRAVSTLLAGGLPFGGWLLADAPVVPSLTALADGLLLGWVLAELRGSDSPEGSPLDVGAAVRLLPGAMLACLLALPARYVAIGTWLALPRLPIRAGRPLLAYVVRGWGPIGLQGAALGLVGIAGAVAWTRGTPGSALIGYARMLRAEGGRLAALLAGSCVAAGGVSALAYALVLSMPAQAWVLSAADAYAHYATLPIGLLLTSALVELGAAAVPAGAIEEPPPP